MAGGGGDGRSVAEKVFAIADAFQGREDLSLSEIAARANLPLSTAHRLVAEWVTWRCAVERGSRARPAISLNVSSSRPWKASAIAKSFSATDRPSLPPPAMGTSYVPASPTESYQADRFEASSDSASLMRCAR